MKKRSCLTMLAAAVAAMAICTGCGGDDTIGGKLVDELQGGSSPSHASGDVTGTWSGRAGTGQTQTVLQLTQNGTSLSGSWMWGAHDTRHCTGYRSGTQVVLKDTRSDGDTWSLTLSSDGRNLSGTGVKYGGGSYAVHFNR